MSLFHSVALLTAPTVKLYKNAGMKGSTVNALNAGTMLNMVAYCVKTLIAMLAVAAN